MSSQPHRIISGRTEREERQRDRGRERGGRGEREREFTVERVGGRGESVHQRDAFSSELILDAKLPWHYIQQIDNTCKYFVPTPPPPPLLTLLCVCAGGGGAGWP